MALNENILRRLHDVMWEYIQDNEPVTLELLAQRLGMTDDQIIGFFAGRLDNMADLGSWREILQYIGHTDTQGKWHNFPGNWFWRNIYQDPTYRYEAHLVKHQFSAGYMRGVFESWRKKPTPEINTN